MIADKFGNSVRTIQRDAARINKIYTDRGGLSAYFGIAASDWIDLV